MTSPGPYCAFLTDTNMYKEDLTMYGHGMGFSNWLWNGAGFMHGPVGLIVMVLFWALIIGLVVKIFQFFFVSKSQYNHSSSLEILKQRYASGEISKAEFEQMKKDIT
jgi:putative membrane protein